MKPIIFLSCGQSNWWPKEQETAAEIKKQLSSEYDVFVATTEPLIQNLNAELLERLKNADYYLFVNFKREELKKDNNNQNTKTYRGSLFTNQELGMAYALGFNSLNMLLFSHREVEGDGLLRFMADNSPKFDDYEQAVSYVVKTVKEKWSPYYSRKLVVEKADINPSHYDWRDRYSVRPRKERIAWMEVKNRRSDMVAFDCVAHLSSIRDEYNNSIKLSDTFPIKCWGIDSYFHTIWPGSSVRFDLFGIELTTNFEYICTHNMT